MGFFDGIVGSALGVVGGLIGADKAADSQEDANKANIQSTREQLEFQREANQKAMDFSERMSNTAFQRGVKDMMASGLNPMLAYSQGGASAPSGVTSGGAATVTQPKYTPTSFANAVQAATAAGHVQQMAAQTDNIKADTVNKNVTSGLINAETRLKNMQSATEGYRPQEVINRSNLSQAQQKRIETLLLDSLDKLRADTDHSRASAQQIRSQNVLMKNLQGSDNEFVRGLGNVLDFVRGR